MDKEQNIDTKKIDILSEEQKNLLKIIDDVNCSLDDRIRASGQYISSLKKDLKNKEKIKLIINLKIELNNALKRHKELLKEKDKDTSVINLPKKVGIKIKEIANMIDIFKEKNDVTGKLKNAAVGTVFSGAIISAISLGATLIGGGTLSVAVLAKLLPTLSYIGLSNLISSSLRDTNWSKFIKEYENKDENGKKIMEFFKEKLVGNEEFIKTLKVKANTNDNNELIKINEMLIVQLKKIIEEAPDDEIKHALGLELSNLMKDLKKCYSLKKDNFIKDKESMTNLEFAQLEKKILSLDIELFKQENFLGEASKKSLQNIKMSTVTMYLSRMILSTVFPSLKFDNVKDLVTPFFMVVINNIVNIFNYKDKIKLKDTKYNDLKIKFNNPDIIRQVTNEKGMSLA